MDEKCGSLLLIDDEELNRDMLGRRLELEGLSVVLAENGRQALSLLERQPFDLLLLDVMMPEMSGLQVLAKVRTKYPPLELPIIMVTANTESQDVVEALRLGANDYITKPVNFPVAMARIEMQLRSKRSHRQVLESQQPARGKILGDIDESTTLHTGPAVNTPASHKFLEILAASDRVRVNIGPYEADGVIGQGAMGIVVKAYDPSLCRYVALKILAPELASCPTSRQRFTMEGRFGAALRHENVVTIYAVSEMDNVPYLVMEFISGRSLQDIIDTGKKFTVEEIARIGRQTALGLAAAHEMRLIHRDVKPANLLVDNNNGCVRIADFGLARALDQDINLSQKGLLVGTPLYMSPEQVDGKPLTPATDLFSLGSVLYTLCAGSLPFTAESMSGILHAVAVKQPPPLRIANPEIPAGLVEVIEKLHAKNPEDRFPSAALLAERLATWT
jgi:DNA-binding response OmpR family regulator